VLLIWVISTWNPVGHLKSSAKALRAAAHAANTTNITVDNTSTTTTTLTWTTTVTTTESTSTTSTTPPRVDALCVTVLRMHSYKGYELELLRRQLKVQTGVFACRQGLVIRQGSARSSVQTQTTLGMASPPNTRMRSSSGRCGTPSARRGATSTSVGS